jgi:hypothetical protein
LATTGTERRFASLSGADVVRNGDGTDEAGVLVGAVARAGARGLDQWGLTEGVISGGLIAA